MLLLSGQREDYNARYWSLTAKGPFVGGINQSGNHCWLPLACS